MAAANVETESALPETYETVTAETAKLHLSGVVPQAPAEGVHTVLRGTSDAEHTLNIPPGIQDTIEPTPAPRATAGNAGDAQVQGSSLRDISPGNPAGSREPISDIPAKGSSSGYAVSAVHNLDDGKDFHRRPSNTHNPIIHLRDKLFPAGAGPAAEYAAPYEYNKNFHATPSATHNPIIAARDALFPAGQGPSGVANAVEYETDPNFHARQSKTHNPIIAARDHLFPAGRGSEDVARFEHDPNFHQKPSKSHNPIWIGRRGNCTGRSTPHVPWSDRFHSINTAQGQCVIEPHTGLPMDLSRGSGKGGIDGNSTNPGYIGGGHEPETRAAIVENRRSSVVIEPHTGLPIDLAQGSGKGGIDGNPTNVGYLGGGHEPETQAAIAENRRSSVVIEPHTGLPMNMELGSGKGGIDGNPLNPGYIGGGKAPEDLAKLDEQRRKSTVLEPHTQLPMNTQLGLGEGGTDGDVNNRGLQTII